MVAWVTAAVRSGIHGSGMSSDFWSTLSEFVRYYLAPPPAPRPRSWQEEHRLLGLPMHPPPEPERPVYDEQGRLMALTYEGVAWLNPGEQATDAQVLERARDERKRREVNAFYESIQRERERLRPGPGMRVDRWGVKWVPNPNGPGWREWGSDPDEPYQIKPNASW